MIERGIIMQPFSVRAILREIEAPGTGKTQSRRPAYTPDPRKHAAANTVVGTQWLKLYVRWTAGERDIRLWVREPWKPVHSGDPSRGARYRTDAGCDQTTWRQARHMPRWASRLTLQVTDMRLQRLQEISEEDARAEGMGEPYLGDGDPPYTELAVTVTRRMQFRNLWNRLHGPDAWDRNEEVVALTFRPFPVNIENYRRAA